MRLLIWIGMLLALGIWVCAIYIAIFGVPDQLVAIIIRPPFVGR